MYLLNLLFFDLLKTANKRKSVNKNKRSFYLTSVSSLLIDELKIKGIHRKIRFGFDLFKLIQKVYPLISTKILCPIYSYRVHDKSRSWRYWMSTHWIFPMMTNCVPSLSRVQFWSELCFINFLTFNQKLTITPDIFSTK